MADIISDRSKIFVEAISAVFFRDVGIEQFTVASLHVTIDHS